jgi:hypothetical protein
MDATQKKNSDSHITNITDTLRKIDSAPSVHHDTASKKAKQIPVDLVEEESMESFPASDPPSHTCSTPGKPEPRRPGQDA